MKLKVTECYQNICIISVVLGLGIVNFRLFSGNNTSHCSTLFFTSYIFIDLGYSRWP